MARTIVAFNDAELNADGVLKEAQSPMGGLYLSSEGGYVKTPDTADLRITSDLDLRVEVDVDTAGTGSGQMLLGKWTGNNAYRFQLSGGGFPQLYLYDGTSNSSVTSSSVFTTGRKWLRATWRQSDGRVQFFTSTDGDAWTQLGGNETISITSIDAGTSPVEVGSNFNGSSRMVGVVHRAQIRDGIGGTIVADPTFQAPRTKFTMAGTTYHDGHRLWTINGTGWEWR